MTPAAARAVRRVRHDHHVSDLAFVNALRAVHRLDPIYPPRADELTYHDAWPMPADGCRRRRAEKGADHQ